MKAPGKRPDLEPEKTKLKNYVSWFEIPAQNFKRAVKFYSKIYHIDMECSEANGYQMAYFPANSGIGGAVICGEGCYPSDQGPLLYLNGGKDLSLVLNQVEKAGGRVLLEKTLIGPDAGYFGLFIDTEGNKLALHSSN